MPTISSLFCRAAGHLHSLTAASVLAALVAAPHVAAADPLGAVSLVGHRAIYELKLKQATDKSGISQANGLLVFEIDGDNCIGYTANMRIRTNLISSEGRVNVIDTRQSAWEGPGSKEMRFGSKEYANSDLVAEVEGAAEKDDDGRNGTAKFVKPDISFNLPEIATFPTEHAKRLVAAGLNGERIDRSLVFNGTDVDKLFRAIAFIGKPMPQDTIDLPDSVQDRSAFDGQRAWPVTVSYFDYAFQDTSGEQTPSHEISFIIFENGVSTDLLMGYGDFSIEGTLSQLTIFESTECEK